ncbi:hypothetical protein C7T35_21720 [Variovorax sp. WS11]|nr:hypothetical protein C7T35_21720 [Variovorax sp. WS11]
MTIRPSVVTVVLMSEGTAVADGIGLKIPPAVGMYIYSTLLGTLQFESCDWPSLVLSGSTKSAVWQIQGVC